MISVKREIRSLMPASYRSSFSEKELNDLLAFPEFAAAQFHVRRAANILETHPSARIERGRKMKRWFVILATVGALGAADITTDKLRQSQSDETPTG